MKETIMQKTIKLGKIDYLGIGRKTCPAEVELELRDIGEGKIEFSACGTVWNHKKTDCYMAGQCIDDMMKYIKTPQMKEIYRLWHLYHLNGMHAGTPKQEAALREWREKTDNYNYDVACKYLESIGLLVDNGYTYGHGWLYEAIPDEDLTKIKKLIEG